MADEANESPFVVGLEVAIVNDRWGFSMTRAEISKVYKSGNFVLRRDSQQYRPSPPVNGRGWVARSTRRDRWSCERIEIITRELEERETRYKRIVRVHNALKRLERRDENAICEDHAADLERIAREIARD